MSQQPPATHHSNNKELPKPLIVIAQDPEAVDLGLGGIALDVVREIVAAVVEQVDRGREVMNDAAAGGDPEVDLAPTIGGGVAVQGRGHSVGVIVMIVAE